MPGATLPPFKKLPMHPPRVYSHRRPDGAWIIRQLHEPGIAPRSVPHLLEQRAVQHPNRPFLAQRTADGPWRKVSYGEINAGSNAIAQSLIDRGMGPETPLMILSGNSIEHAVLMLGAMKARVPVAPVSIAYSLFSQDHGKLKHVAALTRPRMIFADAGPGYAKALAAVAGEGIEIVTLVPVPGFPSTPYDALLDVNVGPAVHASMDKINHDTVGKYLFTSGSTGLPKGVIQTQGMMMHQIAAGEGLRSEPRDPNEVPESLEWMPWNHISAGNVGFNGALFSGGTIYLDTGRPIPGMFEATIKNLYEVAPTVYGSAPIAFAMLAEAMERDPVLRRNFFSKLRYMGYGGATLSSDIAERMQALAIAETGMRIPLTTMYGATETQGITGVNWETDKAGFIGLPFPGLTLKLLPNGQKLEVRVKGPTVTPGYLNRPDLTEGAFDEEGYYKLGDAARFADPHEPAKGLIFDGRVTEDFKLSSGTWVSVGTLRAEAIAAASPLIQDCVVAGQDKDFVGLLAWPNFGAAKGVAAIAASATPDEVLRSPNVVTFLQERFRAYNANARGSSHRIGRVMLMTEPPSIDGHEITDKGYVNQRATLDRRARLVDALYAVQPAEDVVII